MILNVFFSSSLFCPVEFHTLFIAISQVSTTSLLLLKVIVLSVRFLNQIWGSTPPSSPEQKRRVQ